ncbi:hypothetical protein [Streptomyces sp. MMS24-I29]|uniref:hypothetical protein n=1 Tax=Streptomyces sp. MMS24-I29 TaxID=3351480 RepID=UPI003C7E561A
MAKYTRADGVRGITGENGYGWLPVDGAWVRTDRDEKATYTLEKRVRNPKDGTHTTGWYLYSEGEDAADFFGDFTSSRLLEAVDEANHMIARFEKPTPQHKVQAPVEPDDEDGRDAPRSEVTAAELFSLRSGVVVEAHTLAGARVRMRLAAKPDVKTIGAVLLEGTAGERHEVRPESVTVIGVMPRAGDTIEARAKNYTTDPNDEKVVGVSKVMRRKLVRDPWPGNPGQLVVSDGRNIDMVLTSSIVILADAPGRRTDEQRIARAVQLAMPGLDFHTNETSTSAIRVYAKPGEGEVRDDEAVLARNDDIAEALCLAGFCVARRGVGQAVYAYSGRSGHAHGDDICQRSSHKGEPAPWIAVLHRPGRLDSEYACRACVRRHVEATAP